MTFKQILKQGFKPEILKTENQVTVAVFSKDKRIFTTTNQGTKHFLEPMVVPLGACIKLFVEKQSQEAHSEL